MNQIEQKIEELKLQIANKEADIVEAQKQLEHAQEVEAPWPRPEMPYPPPAGLCKVPHIPLSG